VLLNKKEKKMPRIYNRKLKREYDKGFKYGCKAYREKIKKLLKPTLTKQVLDYIETGTDVSINIEVSGKELLEILKEKENDK
jgi:hypothetical protein